MNRISIVVPIYNVSVYVKEAVDSLLCQTADPFEIILVDDGSTDGSGDLIEVHYAKNPLVRIIHTENRGLGAARNRGVDEASGEYIVFLDSDDLAEPDLVETVQLSVVQNPSCDLICYSYTSFLDPPLVTFDPNRLESTSLKTYSRPWDLVLDHGEEIFNRFIEEQSYIPNAWACAVRRAHWVEHRFAFLPILSEDAEFTPRMLLSAGKTVVLRTPLVRYRVRNGSIMRSQATRRNLVGYVAVIGTLTRLSFRSGISDRTRVNLRRLRKSYVIKLDYARRSSHAPMDLRLFVGYIVSVIRVTLERPFILLHFANPGLFRMFLRITRSKVDVYEY